MTRTRIPPVLARLALMFAALVLVGCGTTAHPTVIFEPKGAPLTAATAERLAATTDIASVEGVSVADAPAVRSEMLKQLRAEGVAGTRAATLLTTGFPPNAASVPVLVRACAFEGTSAIVVVEAFGDSTGTLKHRRLWVFDLETGGVIRAASLR